jgi:hypothetical protein
MKYFQTLAVVLLFPLLSLGQSNYKPGLVVTAKGDTLRGFLDLKDWTVNPDNVKFKRYLENSQPDDVGPANFSYFEVFNIVSFKSFTVNISKDETNINRLGHSRDTSARIAKVFLKTEQEGDNLGLYSYSDNLKTRFYVLENQSGQIQELTYRIYYIEGNSFEVQNNVTTVSQNAFRQQLLLLAQKFNTYNDGVKRQISSAEYNESDLGTIFNMINKVTKNKSINDKPYLGIYAGAGYSFNTYTPSGTFPIFNAPGNTSAFPKLSAGIIFYPKRNFSRLVFSTEIAFTQGSYRTTGTLYYYEPDRRTDYRFDQKTFSFIPQVQYYFYNRESFKVYGGVGVAFNNSSYKGNTVYNSFTKATTVNYLNLDEQWFSISLKIGVIVNRKFDVTINYYPPSTISGNYNDYKYGLNMQSLQVGLSYIFK